MLGSNLKKLSRMFTRNIGKRVPSETVGEGIKELRQTGSNPTGSIMSDIDDVIDKVISKPVSVTTVKDGWVFAFDVAILQVLLKAANESPTKKAVVFVTHEGNIN